MILFWLFYQEYEYQQQIMVQIPSIAKYLYRFKPHLLQKVKIVRTPSIAKFFIPKITYKCKKIALL